MKNHLKRISSPKTWIIDRKYKTFITKPKPGAHSQDRGLPLGNILRDILKLSGTMGEIKKILNNNSILVDGKRRKDHRHIVGLFDVLTVELLKKSYRLLLDKKGRIVLKEIASPESNLKPCQVIGKKMLPKNKTQFNLYDGKNIISNVKAEVGDTLLLALMPTLEIKEVLKLQPGALIFLTKGKHSGDLGTLKEIKGNEVIYVKDGVEISTAKKYLFVLGKEKLVIKI